MKTADGKPTYRERRIQSGDAFSLPLRRLIAQAIQWRVRAAACSGHGLELVARGTHLSHAEPGDRSLPHSPTASPAQHHQHVLTTAPPYERSDPSPLRKDAVPLYHPISAVTHLSERPRDISRPPQPAHPLRDRRQSTAHIDESPSRPINPPHLAAHPLTGPFPFSRPLDQKSRCSPLHAKRTQTVCAGPPWSLVLTPAARPKGSFEAVCTPRQCRDHHDQASTR